MKELRVLMLNGSPRANGNTSIALRAVSYTHLTLPTKLEV